MNTRDGTQTGLMIDIDEDDRAKPLASQILDEDGSAETVVDEDGDLVGGIPRRATRNDDGSITLPLRHPVTISIRSAQRGIRQERFAELTFHRLTGADLNAVSAASKESQQSVILARSARMREAIMAGLYEKMDGADILDAGLIVESFFGSGRKTGRST